jgi:hypothetical protein
MSDAPERIWVDEAGTVMHGGDSYVSIDGFTPIEYVRADLYGMVEREWRAMRVAFRKLRDEAIEAERYSYLATSIVQVAADLKLEGGDGE